MALTLTKDNGNERTYRLDDGRKVIVTIDDFFSRIDVKTPDGIEIGEFEFMLSSDDFTQWYYITRMYLDLSGDSYKRKGIGRKCLQFFKELTGCPIFASENDGIRKDDGSHLTEDAPSFVAKMREEGIID